MCRYLFTFQSMETFLNILSTQVFFFTTIVHDLFSQLSPYANFSGKRVLRFLYLYFLVGRSSP